MHKLHPRLWWVWTRVSGASLRWLTANGVVLTLCKVELETLQTAKVIPLGLLALSHALFGCLVSFRALAIESIQGGPLGSLGLLAADLFQELKLQIQMQYVVVVKAVSGASLGCLWWCLCYIASSIRYRWARTLVHSMSPFGGGYFGFRNRCKSIQLFISKIYL